MQRLGEEAGDKDGAMGYGVEQSVWNGDQGVGPWVRTMAVDKGQPLRVWAWGGVGPGLWGGVKDMGWGSVYFFTFFIFLN